jgi:hypothetical protein
MQGRLTLNGKDAEKNDRFERIMGSYRSAGTTARKLWPIPPSAVVVFLQYVKYFDRFNRWVALVGSRVILIFSNGYKYLWYFYLTAGPMAHLLLLLKMKHIRIHR